MIGWRLACQCCCEGRQGASRAGAWRGSTPGTRGYMLWGCCMPAATSGQRSCPCTPQRMWRRNSVRARQQHDRGLHGGKRSVSIRLTWMKKPRGDLNSCLGGLGLGLGLGLRFSRSPISLVDAIGRAAWTALASASSSPSTRAQLRKRDIVALALVRFCAGVDKAAQVEHSGKYGRGGWGVSLAGGKRLRREFYRNN